MTKAAAPPAIRVVFWGTYDLSKPRTRILRDGLQEAGVDVIEIHTDIWARFADKSQMSKADLTITLLKNLLSYPALVFRYMRAPAHDVVVVPYLGQFDVLVLWLFARLKGKPVVWDMFISLYDTVVNDRKMLAKWSPVAAVLKSVEWLGCRAATRVMLDTKAHARYIARLFSLPDGRTDAVPVGAETAEFPRQPPPMPHDGPTRLLFYGQLIPLHGIEIILQAALSDRGRDHAWRIIGKGQQSVLVERRLADAQAPHISRDEWVPYATLVEEIAQADICLGIFGPSEKAASVVPNKVYQCLSAGRFVITRKSPAMIEAFPAEGRGLGLVPHSDPQALLDEIDAARADGFPVMPETSLQYAQPREIGRMFCDNVLVPLIRDGGARHCASNDR